MLFLNLRSFSIFNFQIKPHPWHYLTIFLLLNIGNIFIITNTIITSITAIISRGKLSMFRFINAVVNTRNLKLSSFYH